MSISVKLHVGGQAMSVLFKKPVLDLQNLKCVEAQPVVVGAGSCPCRVAWSYLLASWGIVGPGQDVLLCARSFYSVMTSLEVASSIQ